MSTAVETVIINVSEPFVHIAGGYTSLRPVGLKRKYSADYAGKHFSMYNKAEIQTAIRQTAYRAGAKVRFEFQDESVSSIRDDMIFPKGYDVR
jgi:hypothetical protein